MRFVYVVSMDGSPLRDEDVAALSRRLHGVARGLVFDAGAAEDLVQEAWLAALRAGSATVRHPIRWMSVVMRRRSLRLHTRDVLRKECERLAARLEAANDEDALERASTAAWLLDELAVLGAPYEQVLKQRFLEQRSLRDIAETSGTPLETVRSQERRGLAKLRERLDGRAGSREAWASVLLGAAGAGPEGSTDGGAGAQPAIGELAARAFSTLPGAVVGLAFLSVAAVVLWLTRPGESSAALREPDLVAEARRAHAAELVPNEAVAREPVGAEPAALAAAAQPVEEETTESAIPAIPADVARLRLVVRDERGAPVSGVYGDFLGRDRVSLFDGELGPDGIAVLDVRAADLLDDPMLLGDVVVSMCAPGRAWSDTLAVELELGTERVLEVALDEPEHVLEAVVVGPNGEPVSGARVDVFGLPQGIREIEPGVVATPKQVEARTDAKGHFRIAGLPPSLHRLRIVAHEYLQAERELTPVMPNDAGDLVVPIERSAVLAGRISYPDGRPATRAIAGVGSAFALQDLRPIARTDERGAFRLYGFPYDTPTRVFFFDTQDRSWITSTVVVVREGEAGQFDAVLARSPGLHVRVVDKDGTPVPRACVLALVEEPVSDWSELAVMGADGRGGFLIVPDEPLELRVYREQFAGSGDPLATRRGVRPSTEELVLTLGAPVSLDAELSGRVLGADGTPLAQASAYAFLEGFADLDAVPDGRRRFGQAGLRESEVDADGRFLFQRLEAGEYHVYVTCADPARAGVLDGGIHVVLRDERTAIPTLWAPAPTSMRFVPASEPNGSWLVLGARLGPYIRSFLQRDLALTIELQLFPGVYLARNGEGPEYRELHVGALPGPDFVLSPGD